MKIGAVYPQIDLKGDPVALDRIGRAVERQGFDSLLMYDHVIGAVHENRNPPLWEGGPYTDKDPFHDPFVAFGYLAGITKKIELVTGVLILPQRQTALVAKQATDVDLLSGGRLRLGVGTGWNYVEYDVLGQDFSTRGKRFGEQIELLRKFWNQPLVSFASSYHKVDRANILPRPKRQIPVYCGGYADVSLRRAAKLADGYIFGGPIDGVLQLWEKLKSYLAREGRSIEGFGAEYLLQKPSGYGGQDIDEALDSACRWQDAGGTHVNVVSIGRGYQSMAQHIDFFAEAVDKLKSATA